MNKQLSSSKPGVAKDQLIFIIICSVALAVAAVTLVGSLTGKGKTTAGEWQCLDCGKEFTVKSVTQPVSCPSCGGEAVRLGYRTCSECGEKVLVYRIRMPETPEGAGGPGGPLGMMPMQPMDMQFRIENPDGTYGWSDWISGSSPQMQMMYAGLICPKCGESLSMPGRSRR